MLVSGAENWEFHSPNFYVSVWKLGTNSKKVGFSPAYIKCMAKADEIYIHPHHPYGHVNGGAMKPIL
jgi:hypothetical protein